MMKNPLTKPEVLAPAGSFEAVVAAVQNGADAVYLGQSDFSARQNATNFSKDELQDVVRYCHARDVLVYQALNTVIFDSQIDDLFSCVKIGCDAGVDAFIVQDLAAVWAIKAICPSKPIHGSTQMSVHTAAGARALLGLGISRVVLARELSFEQIREITQSVPIETEVFVHGALCMSVSGQCYISAMIGTRSGNRGSCAGTCRLPFSSTDRQSHDLSLKDLCLVKEIDRLKDIGVTSIKIEGRMKRGEYVAAASQVYSNARDELSYDTDDLQAVFSRGGFTDGYYKNRIGSEMFGVRQKEDVILATDKLLKSIAASYKKEKGRIPLHLDFTLKAGANAALKGYDNDGNCVTVGGDIPQEAVNRAITCDDVKQQLSKLGGTIFLPSELNIDIDGGLSFPASKLNLMRREVCDRIMIMREEPSDETKAFRSMTISTGSYTDTTKFEQNEFSLRARFERFSQIPLDRLGEFSFISLPLDEVKKHITELLPYKDKLLIEPDRFMAGNENDIIKSLSELKSLGFTNLLCNNIAHIQIGNDLKFTCHGGTYLNCANSVALFRLKDMGIIDQTLSFEMNLNIAKKIIPYVPTGLILYGFLPLMLLKNCPIKNQFSCANCDGKKSLTDRMSMKFRVICRERKYSELLNCNELYMGDRLSEVECFSFGTLYFTVEDSHECERVIDEFKNKSAASGNFTRGLYYRNV